LTDYERYCFAENQQDQAVFLKQHLESIRKHICELSEKKYDDAEKSLDFTMMFVPIEPAYLLAMQKDQELWSYAYSKRILLISPTNLIACLKLINDLWKREVQSKNAMEIVKRGEALYEKFVTFSNTLEVIGKNINKTQDSYTDAMNQLKNGKGNLISQATRLKNLGLKSNKTISQNLTLSDLASSDEELNLKSDEIDEEIK
jgi:DNA recombination protein RmuC